MQQSEGPPFAERVRTHRARLLGAATGLAVAVAVVAAIVVGANLADGRKTSAPPPPVAAPPGSQTGCPASPQAPPRMPFVDASILKAQREWLDSLPVGGPPLTPWWHDGVLHAGETEVPTPFQVETAAIEVAGATVLVGNPSWNDRDDSPAQWAVLRGGRLEELPTGDSSPHLSLDGTLAFWLTYPAAKTGYSVVVWDLAAKQELATRSLPQEELLGIDANGVGYLLDRSGPSVTEWDVRADILRPSDVTWDPSTPAGEQCSLLPELGRWRLELGFVSPDGTREVFNGPVPGDSPTYCCTDQLRVRRVGPVGTVESDHVTTLSLPEGTPHLNLWRESADYGFWGVWWESDDTVLLDVVIDDISHLVRCPVTGDTCERVLDLGQATPSSGPLSRGAWHRYAPAWVADWAFARTPLTE